MRSIVPAACLLAAMLAAACTNGIKVAQDYDPATDFGPLEKFAWAKPTEGGEAGSQAAASLLDQRVRRSVEDALFVKGFVKTVEAEADFLVHYYTSIEKKLRVDTNYYGYGYGRYGWGGGYSDTTVREYEEGTLILDVIDPGKQELIWRGTGTARLQESRTPEQREKRVRDAVEKILSNFPPKSKK